MKVNRFKKDYKSYDIWRHYVRRNGRKYCDVDMSQKLHTSILNKFYDKLTDAMIYENIDFSFPHNLGNLSVKKRKVQVKLTPEGELDKSKLRVDWNATYKLREECGDNTKYVYYLNEHTGGYYYRFFWSKVTCSVKNGSVYLLDLRRRIKRKISHAVLVEGAKLDFYEF